jgi:hypothetical protein
LAPEGIKRFRAEYTKKYGDWHEHSLVTGIPLSAVFLAIEQAGTLEVDKIVSVLESGREWKTPFEITGTFAGTKAYGHPHQWVAPQYAIEVQGEKAVPVGVIPIEDMVRALN